MNVCTDAAVGIYPNPYGFYITIIGGNLKWHV